ncbi:MAG: hypothetical protein KGP28_09940, partial [Bdellovibrionales bacterium]|nr:hypothetical protein [Bdellovibrionales bacterium]
MIRKNNPNLKKPNFGGQFLLLQVPYMMGTDWLIMDCKSGRFLKESLSGDAEFHPDSFLVRLREKSSAEWRLWTGTTFVKLENLKENSSSIEGNSLSSRYGRIFRDHPALPSKTICAPLKFSSYFRAQNAESHIKSQKLDLASPNFAGSFLLIRVELLFQTIFLIANCHTGIFYPEFLQGEVTFEPTSRIAVLTKSGKSPEVFLWQEPVWIKRPDSTLAESPLVFNEVTRDEARAIIRLIPNPQNRSRVEFEDLRCRNSVPTECSFLPPDAKNSEKRIPFLAPPGPEVMETL